MTQLKVDLSNKEGTYSKSILENYDAITTKYNQYPTVPEFREYIIQLCKDAKETPAKQNFINNLNRQTSTTGLMSVCTNALLAGSKLSVL